MTPEEWVKGDYINGLPRKFILDVARLGKPRDSKGGSEKLGDMIFLLASKRGCPECWLYDAPARAVRLVHSKSMKKRRQGWRLMMKPTRDFRMAAFRGTGTGLMFVHSLITDLKAGFTARERICWGSKGRKMAMKGKPKNSRPGKFV